MKWVLICALAFLIASNGGSQIGEFAWLMLVAVICISVAGMMNRYWRVIPAMAGGTVLVFHFGGYKLYGSATICGNEPLDAPQELAALAAPNVVVMKNGDRLELHGVTFDPDGMLSMDHLRRLLRQSASSPQPILVQPDSNAPSGVVIKAPVLYFCGNTFFPCFHPQRLPRYGKADLGLWLLDKGACERAPSEEKLTEQELYRSPWMDSGS